MGLNNTFKRYEMKYLISQNKKREIENLMGKYIEPDKYFHSLIQNIYYDTPDYRLIRTSMEKPVYKEKLRLRCASQPYQRNLSKKSYLPTTPYFLLNFSIRPSALAVLV